MFAQMELMMFATSLPPALSAQQHQELVDALAHHMTAVAPLAANIDFQTPPKDRHAFGELPTAFHDATKIANPSLTEDAQRWMERAQLGPAPGSRLQAERDQLAQLTADWGKPGADQPHLLGELQQMGGKMIAAIMEEPVEQTSMFNKKSAQTGAVKYEHRKQADVAALLEKGGEVAMRRDLLPGPMTGPLLKVFQDATVDFAKTYGTAAGLACLHALAKAGAAEEMMAPLRAQLVATIEDRSAVAKIALHGSTDQPRVSTPRRRSCARWCWPRTGGPCGSIP